MTNVDRLADLRERAYELLRDRYAAARDLSSISPRTYELINRVRPPEMRYDKPERLGQEFWAMAGAVATFAVELGLITPEQAADFIRTYSASEKP